MKTGLKKIVAAAALLLAGAGGLQAQLVSGSRGSDDVKIGIAGYTYRNFDLEQTCRMLQDMGVKYLSVKDWWLPLDATELQMDSVKQMCASYGIDGYTLGPVYMHSKADVDKTFAYAGRYGVPFFIGVPDYELIDYTIEKVKDTGIKVAIHTHGPDGAAFPDIYKIVELVKDPSLGVGACLDLGHCVRMGQNVAEILVDYKDWIYDIHIKDETAPTKAGQTWEMGRGVIDFRPIAKSLREIEYKGVVSMEFEKNGNDPNPGVRESIGYFRGILDATR
jgi:Sugar phosphate isomerases/epimerases